MAKQVFALRDLPRYETLRALAARYPEIDAASITSSVLLVRIASDMLARVEDFLADYHMSQGRFIVLALLNRTPELAQNPCQLAHKAGVTRATMTGLLDGLQREGLLARQSVPEDRRMLRVRLTPKGRKFLDSILPGYFRMVRHTMGGLNQREKEDFIHLLSKLGAAFEAPVTLEN